MENTNALTKVIGVCGLGCVGKTHYCRQLLRDYKEKKWPRPIVLSLGKFFRETLGPNFFVHLDSPAAPAVTEHWVHNMVYFSIDMAYTHGCDVILDGFPRTALQLEWLLLSSSASKYNLPITLRFLSTFSKEEYSHRVDLRCKESNLDETELLGKRLSKDAALLSGLLTAAKRTVGNKNYLEIEEIEY